MGIKEYNTKELGRYLVKEGLRSHWGSFEKGLGKMSIQKVILKFEEVDQKCERDKTQGTFAITHLKEVLMWLDCQALGGNQVDFSGPRGFMKKRNKGTKKICDGALPTVPLHFRFRTSRRTSCAYPILARQSALPSHSLTATHITSAMSHNTPASLELIEHWSQQTLVYCLEWEKMNFLLHTTWTEPPFLTTFKFCRPCVSIYVLTTFPEHILCLSLITLL